MNIGVGWHPASPRALVLGLGERKKHLGTDVHFIQVSGTTSLSDSPSTGYVETRTFSDEEDIYSYEKYRESIESYMVRKMELAVIETGEEAGVSTYIVSAPTIYGMGTGLFNRYSIQIPYTITAALEHGSAFVVGKGDTSWSHVHVQDLADFFVLLLRNVCQGVPTPSGRKGIYFCETGLHTHLEISEKVGKALFDMGLLKSSSVQSVSQQQGGELLAVGSSMAELSFGSK